MKQISKRVSMFFWVASWVLGPIAALAVPAAAQPSTPPGDQASGQQSGQQPGPAAPAPGPVDTPSSAANASLGEVLQVAVRQQATLVKASIDIDVANASALEASGIHDWVIDATGRVVRSRSKTIDRNLGIPLDSELDLYDLSANATRFFGIGGTLTLHADGGYRNQSTTAVISGIPTENVSETYETNLSATYTQSLLRGRGREYGEAAQRQAAISRDATFLAQRSQAATTVRVVVDAYWDLVLAERELEISKNSLALANQQLRNTRVSISAGSVAATEALAVEQTIALREEEVLLAELAISQRALDLRRQAGMEIGPGAIDLATNAALGLTPKPLDVNALLARAFANSPQIAQLETLRKGAVIDVEVTENGLLPELDFSLTLGTGGSDESASESLKQPFKLDNTAITGTLTFRHTLGNRAGQGAHRRARSELYRQQVDLGDVKAQIASSLVLAVKQAQAAQRRVDLSQRAIELAEKNIAAEQARFDLGRATNFDVLQRQDELRQAQQRKARATVDYLKAASAIDAITGDILPKYGIKLDP